MVCFATISTLVNVVLPIQKNGFGPNSVDFMSFSLFKFLTISKHLL